MKLSAGENFLGALHTSWCVCEKQYTKYRSKISVMVFSFSKQNGAKKWSQDQLNKKKTIAT